MRKRDKHREQQKRRFAKKETIVDETSSESLHVHVLPLIERHPVSRENKRNDPIKDRKIERSIRIRDDP